MFNSFDIETYSLNNKLIPFCISMVYKNKAFFYYGENCISEFLNAIFELATIAKTSKKKHNLILFSHNLTFDGSIIIQNLQNSPNIRYNGIFFKGQIYGIFLSQNTNLKISLKCSYKFFPAKLSKAHQILNTNKKLDFSVNNLTINETISQKDTIIEYCINDSKIVSQIINKYDEVLGNICKSWYIKYYSIPSTSLNIFFDYFNLLNIKEPFTARDDTIFRSAYYGGRCEVYGNPDKDDYIYHYDFSGMYAQCMQENFCYGPYKINYNITNIIKPGFYFITFISNIEIPILPHHSILNNKLMFTNGEISGLYWKEEIDLFLKNKGKILKIHYFIEFKFFGPVFKHFTSFFTELRNSSFEANFVCKILINSLYGRLGMAPSNSETIVIHKNDYYTNKMEFNTNISKETWIDDFCILEIEKKINPDEIMKSNVSLAATITSKARIKLYKGFQDVIENGGRILYTDTDSIFASYKRNVDNEIHGNIFWDISKKDTKIKNALFAMPKAYALEFFNNITSIKIKGISQNTIDFETFKNCFISESDIELKISCLFKANYVITPKNISKIINLTKYDKRKFLNKKIFTIPFHKINDMYV